MKREDVTVICFVAHANGFTIEYYVNEKIAFTKECVRVTQELIEHLRRMYPCAQIRES